MLDIYSDQSQFGGLSKTELEICTENDESFLRLKGTLAQEQSGLVPIDYMFTGFRCLNLVTEHFDYFNGFRVTMRRPSQPCKFGVYLQTNLKEYEHYVAHVVDVTEGNSEHQPFVEYEIPAKLMMHNMIRSKIVQAQVDEEYFQCKGITFSVEKANASDKKRSVEETEVTVDVKKIDVIYNSEYDKMVGSKAYILPIMFKSLASRQLRYFKQGFVDNGRQQVAIEDPEKPKEVQQQTINSLAYDQAQSTSTFSSIKDKLIKQKKN